MDDFKAEDFYSAQIQPIFDSRCVTCHSCFNSPCQLNLSAYEGVVRGANKISIYDFPKLESREPTRLFIDAHSTEAWRKLNFYSVLSEGRGQSSSIFSTLLKDFKGVESGLQSHYDSEGSRVCVQNNTEKEWSEYVKSNPAGRMPFGFPALSKEQVETIETWQASGSLGPDTKSIEARILGHQDIAERIQLWESLLNQDSMQAKISSRYIYEHLFLAHLYFREHPHLSFRLVRSKTSKGEIEEIGSLYPFDHPGVNFTYRLRPMTNTKTHKDHIPYLLTSERMQAWKHSFYESSWIEVPNKMPAYGRSGGNPFKTFASIPVKARYQFLLDDAGYHVMTFIKGPVCRGQTALNVINDNFWVFFLSPDIDPMVQSAETYKKIANIMEMPAQIKDDFAPSLDFREKYWQAIQYKYAFLKENQASSPLDFSSIWSAQKKNNNAALTVYRHFNSATVLRGLQGAEPKTAWVLDYHVFETIYYNLTAGYNVFGPVLHQLNSRLFMEISRIASEDLFISFLPQSERVAIRESWNVPIPEKKQSLLIKVVDFFRGNEEEKLKFDFPFYGKELLASEKLAGVKNKRDLLYRMREELFSTTQVNGGRAEISRELNSLTQLPWQVIRYLPDTLFIKYKKDQIYTLIHNKEHYNVGMLFFENERRWFEKDSLDLLPGIASSYANYFLVVEDEKDLEQIVTALKAAKNSEQVRAALKVFGISRVHPDFWFHYDWFTAQSFDPISNESGILDLNRYENF